MNIEITPLPTQLLEKLQAAGCTTPKQCYGNCMAAVTNFNLAEKYVLCFAEIESGEKLGHAVIKISDKYYDPTLELQEKYVKKYWLHTEFSKSELREFVKEQHKHVLPKNGEIEVYPPSLRQDGSIVCEEVYS